MSITDNSSDGRRYLPVEAHSAFEPSGQIYIRDLIDLLASGIRVIGLVTAIGLLLGIAFCLILAPTYKADGTVQVEENQKGGAGSTSSDLSSLFLGTPVQTEGEIELLHSRLVLNPVVDELRLLIDVKPHYFPLIGEAVSRWSSGKTLVSAPPLLGGYAWGGEQIVVSSLEVPFHLINRRLELAVTSQGYDLLSPSGAVILSGKVGELATADYLGDPVSIRVEALMARPGTSFKITRFSREHVLSSISKNFIVTELGRQSGVIKLEFYGTSPQKVSSFIDSVERSYLQQNVERRSADARKSLDFLTSQLPEQKKQVEEAKRQLASYQSAHASVDLSQETEIDLKTAESLEAQRRGLEQQKLQQLTLFTPSHASVKTIDAQIKAIEADQQSLKTKTGKLPPTQQAYLSLLTEADVETELYSQMLNSIQSLKVAKAGIVGNVRVVDEALDPADPFKPTSPDPALILPLSLIVGLIAGIGYVLIRRLLLRGLDNPEDIERQFGLATFALVPYSPEERKLSRSRRKGLTTVSGNDALLAIVDSKSPVIESIRSLQTALHFALLNAGNNVTMFTGPAPGVGKSFVVANFGAVLALSGKRVVVIDADLRRGLLHQYFSMDGKSGLSSYVVSDIDETQVVRRSNIEGLDVICRGSVPPNPAELLRHERFASLIQQLSTRYDHVLIDTPPMLAVTDAAIVGRLAAATILVLKSATHPAREIEETLKRLLAGGVRVDGAVINQVGLQLGSYGFGNYGYKYYRYED